MVNEHDDRSPNSHDDPNEQQEPAEAATSARQVKPFGETTIFGTFVFGDPAPAEKEAEK